MPNKKDAQIRGGIQEGTHPYLNSNTKKSTKNGMIDLNINLKP